MGGMLDGRGDVGWSDFVHEERLGEHGACWQWGDVRGPFRWERGMDSRLRGKNGGGHGRGMGPRIREDKGGAG